MGFADHLNINMKPWIHPQHFKNRTSLQNLRVSKAPPAQSGGTLSWVSLASCAKI